MRVDSNFTFFFSVALVRDVGPKEPVGMVGLALVEGPKKAQKDQKGLKVQKERPIQSLYVSLQIICTFLQLGVPVHFP